MCVISIGPIEISTYWLMLIVGTLGMLACVLYRRKLFSLSLMQSAGFVILLTAAGVVGAMLMYFLESGTLGGVSFFGSVFLIPILMSLVGFLFHLKPGQTLDICAPCVAIMIGCMRFNCFLSGCCGGWQVCIGSLCFSWPTQALDSIGDFAILLWLLQRENKQGGKGILYPLFMGAYSLMRFFLEFLRDTPKDILGMSNGQWYSIIAVLVGAIWLTIQRRKEQIT